MSKKRSATHANQGHQVGPGTVVSLAYALFDAEGEKVEESEAGAPLEALIGFGEVAPALERALEGLSVGAHREVTLRAEDAYGTRDPRAIIEVDRADLPADVEPGDELSAERENGAGSVVLRVLDLREDVAVLDTNHPLAGQQIRVVVEILAVRPATEEEMLTAAERLERRSENIRAPLLPAERLLRRRRAGGSGGSDSPPGPPNAP